MKTETCISCGRDLPSPITRHHAPCGAWCQFASAIDENGFVTAGPAGPCHYESERYKPSCPNGCFDAKPKVLGEDLAIQVEAKWVDLGLNSHFLFVKAPNSSGDMEWNLAATIYLRNGSYGVYVDGEDNGDAVSYTSTVASSLQEAKSKAVNAVKDKIFEAI